MYGLKHEILLWIRYAIDVLQWLFKYRNCALSRQNFELDKLVYSYILHPYNHTWCNERAIELPVVFKYMSQRSFAHVLEIGNVISYYKQSRHDVLDKYEHGVGIIREDILSYEPVHTYDLIVSISTIEHVGIDENPKNPEKVLDVFPKIMQMLAPGGCAIITFPVGYNKFLDSCIKKRIVTSKSLFMKRISKENNWKETDLDDVMKCKYASPYPAANGVVFLIFEK